MNIPNYWPLAGARQAKKQGIKLLRAKRYLRERNIDAMALNSEFKYDASPKALMLENAQLSARIADAEK